jgi:superfamily I DNA/RNA helicase/mRNA-degrading endonuclease RelE of RelBE toxin-antitoxin system
MLFYQLVYTKTFSDQLQGLPKPTRHQVVDKALSLQTDPRSHGDVKKKLHGYKGDIYRLRSGDFRILYAFGEGYVRLLGVDDRKDVYKNGNLVAEGLNFDPSSLPDETTILEVEPRRPRWKPAVTASDKSTETASAMEPTSKSAALHEPPSRLDLPRALDADLLRLLRIPGRYVPALTSCKTIDDLIQAPIPEELRNRVFNAAATPNYDQIAQDPMYHADSADLLRQADGDLVNFLLQLDPEQERYVNWAIHGAGPNLLKGGPGTGKSIVAIYRTRAVIRELRKFGIAQPRVLFTSYTNALVNSSRQLLLRLLGSDMSCVTVCTADSLVSDIFRSNGLTLKGTDDGILRHETHVARESFNHGSTEDRTLADSIAHISNEYLSEEVDRVIVGREHDILADYLAADRSGRRVRLSENQRRAIWRFAEVRRERLAKKNQHTFAENRRIALELVRADNGLKPFDAVIIDEAQDLDPTVIRLLIKLCKSPDRLFLTADANQSIYGSGFRWKDIHYDLRFRGRTGMLRRNYRSTKQIGAASAAYLTGAEIDDNETDHLESTDYVRSGETPFLIRFRQPADELNELFGFLRMTTRDLHVGLGSCAVLVPDEALGKATAFGLNQRGLAAKFMASKEVDLNDPVVKVLTMHAAKGLEFPIVALAGLRANSRLLRLPEMGSEEEITEELSLKRRVLHVAMTRAMRELLVLVPADYSSPVLTGFDERYWLFGESGGQAFVS